MNSLGRLKRNIKRKYFNKEIMILCFMNREALIVVYKDELLANQLKKLVETKDDIDEEKQ